MFKFAGQIHADKIERLTKGLFKEEVEVMVNKLVFDYDEFFIIGPVFPHEVVGFSGGHKYIFPGVATANHKLFPLARRRDNQPRHKRQQVDGGAGGRRKLRHHI